MQILIVIFCVMLGGVVLMFALIAARLSGGKKFIITKPKVKHDFDTEDMAAFAKTHHGREVAAPYVRKISRGEKDIARLEKKGRRTRSKSRAERIANRIQKKSRKLQLTEGTMIREVGLLSRGFRKNHKGKTARIKGSNVSLGIRREGHGGHFLTSERRGRRSAKIKTSRRKGKK